MSWSHRERALAALHHQEPDRVPIDLGSTRNTGILMEPYEALADYLAEDTPRLSRDDFGQSKIARVANPSEAVLRRLDIDFRGLYLGAPDRPLEKMLPDGSHQDELGVVRRRPEGSYYYDIVHSPFDREMTVADLKQWAWPDPTARSSSPRWRGRAWNG